MIERIDTQLDLQQYELTSLKSPETPATLSAKSSRAPLHASDPIEGTTIQELAPIDGGIRAWTFCFCGFFLEMMVWGFGFSYGIFQDYYTSHPPFQNSSSVAISAVGTVNLAITYGEALLLSFVYGRYPDFLRVGMWSGLVLYFTSLFFSSFATEIWQLILLQGVGVGIGNGLLYMPVIRLLPEWFSERRGFAGGIIFAGTFVGGFVLPFALNALLDNLGLRWTLRVWAIVSSALAGLTLLGMRSRVPVPKFNAGQRRPRFIPPHIGFIKKPMFWTFLQAVTNMLQGLSYFPVSLYIATFTKNFANQITATVVLSLFNSSAVVGQILLGHLTDKIPYPVVMAFCALGSALAAFFLWGFANTVVLLYFFAVIFGALSGGFSSTWPNAAAESAGSQPEYTGMAFAGTAFFKGISAVVGPIIAGMLLQAGKGAALGGGFGRFGYGAVEMFVGSCAIATGLGSVVLAVVRQRAALT
ncbi:MFS general substrate transporter [Trametes elegans]|nr:MFS general substrate transporter [Trametes elegans]